MSTLTTIQATDLLYPTSLDAINYNFGLLNTNKIETSLIAVPYGLATLDGSGQISISQLPVSSLVTSVNNRYGDVVINKYDVGLDNVKNVDTTTTTNVSEGTNLYYTDARVNANSNVTTAFNHAIITNGNPHQTKLDSLYNVRITSLFPNQVLSWDGSNWVNSGVGAGNVIGTSSSTDGNIVLFAGTTGKAIKDSGLTISGNNTGDETTSTIKTKLGVASASTDGYLSSTDWSTFNGKQAALNGTGFVKISGTTISYDNSTYYLASNPSSYIPLTALSSTATGLTYTNTTGVFSLTSGYQIPTTTLLNSFVPYTGASGAVTLGANALTTTDSITSPVFKPASDGATAQRFTKADGSTDVVTINTSTPAQNVYGNLNVFGNIVQSGSSYETHAEQVYTTKDLIITRDGAVAGLSVGEYTGFKAHLYDGTNDGQLVFDKDGWARVGDVGSLQKLATIEETSSDTGVAFYNSSALQLQTNTGFTYNSGTNTLTATTFIGALTGNASSSTYSSNSTIVDDTTTNATMYPVWVTTNTGNIPLKVSSTKISFNPSTGTLTKLIDNTNSINVLGTAGAGYMTLIAQSSNPTAPSAGTLLLHSSTTQGFTRMEQDNEATTNLIYGRDSVFIAKNTSGGNILKGQSVYVSGSTGNVPNIALAKADSITTLPSVAIALDNINNNAFGQIMMVGIVSNIDTSAFSTGDQLYVSTTVAGGLTNVRPSGTTNIVQRIGSVLVSGVGNGSIMVLVAPALLNIETGTNAATWTGSAIIGTSLTSPIWKPASDSTTAINITKADGTTSILNVDTTNSRLGIGTVSPVTQLNISSTSQNDNIGLLQIENTTASTGKNASYTVKNYYGTGQFMEWENFGTRIGNRIITNSGGGNLYFTSGNDSVGITLLATGNVGIGTTSPTSGVDLHISNNPGVGTFKRGLRVENTDTNATTGAALQMKTGASANIWHWFARNGDMFAGIDSTADYMVIKSGGNIGISASSPSQRLHIGTLSGVAVGNYALITNITGATTGAIIGLDASNNMLVYNQLGTGDMSFATANTERMIIYNDGHIAFANSSLNNLTASGSSATPTNLNLGNNYSNGSTRDKCKIFLYNSGTEQYGFGVGANGDIQYHSNATHDFYIANVKIFSVSNMGVTTYGYGYRRTITTYTTNQSLVATYDDIVRCNSATAFTITLPTAVGITGKKFTVKNINSGIITINTTSSQTIDNNASGTLTINKYNSVDMVSDGANWMIL